MMPVRRRVRPGTPAPPPIAGALRLRDLLRHPILGIIEVHHRLGLHAALNFDLRKVSHAEILKL